MVHPRPEEGRPGDYSGVRAGIDTHQAGVAGFHPGSTLIGIGGAADDHRIGRMRADRGKRRIGEHDR